MARCKVYEIQGADPARTAGAVRCACDSAGKVKVDGKSYSVCKKHRGKAWKLFRKGGWLYAVDLDAKK
jgi:hypothetical protein